MDKQWCRTTARWFQNCSLHAANSVSVSGDTTAEKSEVDVGPVKIPASNFTTEPTPVETHLKVPSTLWQSRPKKVVTEEMTKQTTVKSLSFRTFWALLSPLKAFHYHGLDGARFFRTAKEHLNCPCDAVGRKKIFHLGTVFCDTSMCPGSKNLTNTTMEIKSDLIL